MSEPTSSADSRLFSSPFCKEYWAAAAAEFSNLKMLLFAALMVALRVALKAVSIPIAADLRIGVGFFVNAFGSMVYGPLVALLGAAVSDTLGALLFPQGVYFFPFIFTEMAGSLFFALFLYRAKVTVGRVILSRFSIDLIVNILMTTPIMWLYYKMVMGKSYALFDWMRIAKNLVLFPVESLLLTVFLRLVMPAARRSGLIWDNGDALFFKPRTVALLAALFLAGAAAAGGYWVNYYNTHSFSADYSAVQRLENNRRMAVHARAAEDALPEDTVAVIQSARSRVGESRMTYACLLYTVDADAFRARQAQDSTYGRETLEGYSKSKAAQDPALILIGEATFVEDKHTGALLSAEVILTQEELP